jgi:transcriptional regulator with XRE-family HTH domain
MRTPAVRVIPETVWEFRQKSGRKLRAIRNQKGFTLRDVQDMTGINLCRISALERGEYTMSLIEAMKFTKVYNISMARIFEDLWDLIEVSD